MDKIDENRIISHYSDLINKHGYSHKSIGWGKKRHYLRYEILISEFLIQNKSLLDFGCGFGDLKKYLSDKDYIFKYAGVDINRKFIKVGKKIHKDIDIYQSNAFEEGLRCDYDYIISSGVHNTKITNNWSFICQTFELFNKYSKFGFALNFLSDNGDFFDKDLYYANPSKILELASKYSKKIVLKHDYMPYEFTIIVHKNYKITNKNVFEDYSDKIP